MSKELGNVDAVMAMQAALRFYCLLHKNKAKVSDMIKNEDFESLLKLYIQALDPKSVSLDELLSYPTQETK